MSAKETASKIFRGILTLAEAGLVGFGAWYLYNHRETANPEFEKLVAEWRDFQKTQKSLNQLPAETPMPPMSPQPNLPETPRTVDRAKEWSATWPKDAQSAANMFGGNAEDWQKNPNWSGNTSDEAQRSKSTYYRKDYYPIEWRTKTQDIDPKAFNYWPKTPIDAVMYFFPNSNLTMPQVIELSSWMLQGEFGEWELMQDHWKDGVLPVDLSAVVHPGIVAEGYTAHGDDIAENDRNFVAWGGPDNGVNAGLALPLVSGQGMTFWEKGTDPNKIAIEGKPYPIPYYIGPKSDVWPNGEQLGPTPFGFTPIYNAPGYNLIGFVQRSVVQQIDDMALPPKIVSNPQTGKIVFEAVGNIPTRPSFASNISTSMRNPWKGMSSSRSNFSGNGRM